MIILQYDLNNNNEPVVVGKKFITYLKLGEVLAYRLCLGYKVTVELFDRFGNGQILFKHKDEAGEAVVEFEAIKVEDLVTIEYNKLAEVKRLYK